MATTYNRVASSGLSRDYGVAAELNAAGVELALVTVKALFTQPATTSSAGAVMHPAQFGTHGTGAERLADGFTSGLRKIAGSSREHFGVKLVALEPVASFSAGSEPTIGAALQGAVTMVASGAIAAGDPLADNIDGSVIKATAGLTVYGYAVSAASGGLVEAVWFGVPMGVV